MLWRSGRRSGNIQDNRGLGKAALGGGGGMLLIGLVVALLGGDPTPFLQEGISRGLQTRTQESRIPKAEQDELVEFMSVVLAGTEDVWHAKLGEQGVGYSEPKMIVFSGATRSACGNAVSAMGPFYCPLDQTVYLDVEFFYDLKNRHDAPGDFAQAYVIAHEVGHHVQNLLGVLDQVDRAKGGMSQSRANALSVKTELMADCFAGIWARETQSKGLLEQGDIEEALNAASHIGDDVLQQQGQGYVVPDSFTHGTAQQRYQWFKTGFSSGDIDACNSFAS